MNFRVNDKQQGLGKFLTKSGLIVNGEWKEGKLTKRIELGEGEFEKIMTELESNAGVVKEGEGNPVPKNYSPSKYNTGRVESEH